MKGKQINSLRELADAAMAKRSIIMPDTYFRNRAMPAAWLLCMQAMEVHRLMTYGMFIYEKRPQDKFSKAPWNRDRVTDFQQNKNQ